MDWATIKGILSLPAKSVAIACAAAWVLLLLPENVLVTLGFAALRAGYRPWIGAAALISTVWLGVLVLWWLGEHVGRNYIEEWLDRGRNLSVLRELSQTEKDLLRQFYLEKATTTWSFHMTDGRVGGLVQKGVLYQASSIGTIDGFFAYNVAPWAWKLLQEQPDLV